MHITNSIFSIFVVEMVFDKSLVRIFKKQVILTVAYARVIKTKYFKTPFYRVILKFERILFYNILNILQNIICNIWNILPFIKYYQIL